MCSIDLYIKNICACVCVYTLQLDLDCRLLQGLMLSPNTVTQSSQISCFSPAISIHQLSVFSFSSLFSFSFIGNIVGALKMFPTRRLLALLLGNTFGILFSFPPSHPPPPSSLPPYLSTSLPSDVH